MKAYKINSILKLYDIDYKNYKFEKIDCVDCIRYHLIGETCSFILSLYPFKEDYDLEDIEYLICGYTLEHYYCIVKVTNIENLNFNSSIEKLDLLLSYNGVNKNLGIRCHNIYIDKGSHLLCSNMQYTKSIESFIKENKLEDIKNIQYKIKELI